MMNRWGVLHSLEFKLVMIRLVVIFHVNHLMSRQDVYHSSVLELVRLLVVEKDWRISCMSVIL